MRIVHLNTHDSGGSWVYARTLSDALCEAGHDSVVRHRDLVGRPLSDKVLRRASLAMARGAWHGTRRTLPPPPAEWIEGADVVHLHTVADWFDVPRWVRTLPRGMRLVVGLHDLWHVSGGCFVHGRCERFRVDCRPCPLLHAPTNLILAANELQRKMRTYRDAEARFIANSRWLRETVKDSPVLRGQEIAVVPPPVDTAVFHPQDRGTCRTRFGLNSDNLVVATGCASLTDANKDTPGLLRRLAELELPGLKVLMFGDGEITIPNGLDVHRCGPIREKHKLATIYGAADLFVSASRMETYGLTLAEAYACGCGVVAHDTGGIPEALPRDPSVALVPLGDRGAFVDGMREQLRRCAAELPAVGINRTPPCAPSPRQAIEMLSEVYGAA
jgi:glycosyltransferase involved in cell wall biosynthesis